jgi:CHRD domain
MNRIIGKSVKIGVMALLLLTLIAMSSLVAFAHSSSDHDTQTTVSLKHTPHGHAKLKWDPASEKLTVTIKLTGLQANTRHPAHIHAGDCSVMGKIIYPLSDVVADSAGNAVSTTTIDDVDGGIPASGWYINVHSGPTLATSAQALAISCGNVSNPDQAHSVSTRLGGTIDANQMAYGTAHLSLHDHTLTVKVTEKNLVPGSSHAIHIHAGSCQNQIPGKVLYPLTTLTANSDGVATSVTTIKDVKSIPEIGWYINVHFSTDLTTQTGFDPIDCGNVTV